MIEGKVDAWLALLSPTSTVNDPLEGQAAGSDDLAALAAAKHAWFTEHQARLELIGVTRGGERAIAEAELHLTVDGRVVTVPVAVVAERDGPDRLGTVHVYHSLWPLLGSHRVRPPILPENPRLEFSDVVAEYQRALAAGDLEGVVGAFEPDGYLREPSGGVHRGELGLREFFGMLFGPGGVGLDYCTITDDGVRCALEFNAMSWGKERVTPQAGAAVYERGPSGKLAAARIYDDVDVLV